MNQITEDRRVRRTKKFLKEGLCYMLKEKNISEITIKEITDVVDLNRRTFYLHYKDIYDLFEQMENDVIEDVSHLLGQSFPIHRDDSLYNYLNQLLEYIDRNFIICKTIFRQPNKDFINKSMKSLMACYEMSDAKYTFTYYCYGILGTIDLWLSEEKPKTVSEIAQFLYNNILEGYTSSVLI